MTCHKLSLSDIVTRTLCYIAITILIIICPVMCVSLAKCQALHVFLNMINRYIHFHDVTFQMLLMTLQCRLHGEYTVSLVIGTSVLVLGENRDVSYIDHLTPCCACAQGFW